MGSNSILSKDTKSDWPLALILDEMWLRVHRILVHRLEGLGLWPETASYNCFIKEQKALGQKLKQELLTKVLDPVDYACLASEGIFGPFNQRFQARLPFVLAFGYELGLGSYSFLNDSLERATRTAELCALFNLGISIFDLLYDNYPELFKEFSQTFNEQVLHHIQATPGGEHELELSNQNFLADELRILLKIIVHFFLEW